MTFMTLGAGVALICFAVRFLRKGLDRLFGGPLFDWLKKMTSNRFSAAIAGIVTGAVAPSSTGLSLLTSQFLNAGSIATTCILAVLLGGNIGITFLAHLISFNLTSYVGIFLFLGIVGFQFSQRPKVRGVGQCLLAMGFLFLSMQFIENGSAQISANHDLEVVFGILNKHLFLLASFAMLMAVIMQSSTACIGLGIGFASSGVLQESALLPWVLGTNIGMGITSLFVFWESLEGRRIGWANLMAKSVTAVLFIVLLSTYAVPFAFDSLSVQYLLPIWHTIFNLSVAIIALPFLRGFLVSAQFLFVPDRDKADREDSVLKSYLDATALENPSIALAYATRETLRMSDAVGLMVQHLVLARKNANVSQANSVKCSDDEIDKFNQDIILYVSQVGDSLNDYDRTWQLTLLNFSNELETIGDIIEKSLCDTVIKEISEKFIFTPSEADNMHYLFDSIIQRLHIAGSLISDRNVGRAKEFLAAKSKIDSICFHAKREHLQHLHQASRDTLHASLCFLDMVDVLQRINSHITAVVYPFVPVANRNILS